MKRALKDVADLLKTSKRIGIILHQKPDGDAIGSAVALYLALSPDKEVEIISSTEVAEIFHKVVTLPPVKKLPDPDNDCLVILDCSESHRTGFSQLLKKNKKKIIVLDHHNSGDLVKGSSASIVNQSYCACAEIIDDLLCELRLAVSPSIATALLLGIFTDTGGFKHPNTSQQTLNRASRLIRNGGNLQKINTVFMQKLTQPKRKLWGEALSSLEINCWGMAVAKISEKSLSKAGAQSEDVFGLANIIALTHEARAALVLIEQPQHWRGILRTRHNHIDIGRLAKLLGGKGQKKAAGFMATKKIFSGIIYP